MIKKICTRIAFCFSVFTVFSTLLLISSPASADTSGTVNISVEVPSSCSLTLTDGANNIKTISNTITPGTRDAIGTANFKAICNDPGGLAVYAVGYTGSTYGETDLVANDNSGNVIETGYTANNPTDSEWYMSLAPVSGTYAPTIPDGAGGTENFTTNHVIPETYTKVAYRNSNTDVDSTGYTATGANFTATFGAYIAPTQPSGIYEGKVKFLLIHPSTHAAPVTPVAVPHQICYYGNGEDEGSMACQTTEDGAASGFDATITSGSSVTLRASNFSRVGFGFTGWNTKEDGTGTQYGPNETITFTQDMYDNGLMLFANWKAAETGVTMQTFDDTASPYSTAPNGTVIALKDIRDNDVYAVAKLADGNWWMIENLRLDYDANITTSNTQSNNSAFGGVFAGLAEPETADFSNSTTANTLYSTTNITGSNQVYRFPRYNNNNIASRATSNTTSNTTVYGYGNYYTWSATIADTTNYTTENQSVTNTSLCPTGWHLPKGGNKSNEANNEWWNLIVNGIMNGTNPANYDSAAQPNYTGTPEGADASKALRAYPTNLVYSGYYNSSSAYSRGTGGIYWSSTVRYFSYAYSEYLSSNFVSLGTSNSDKYYGLTVRCLADQKMKLVTKIPPK